jgi:signal transduction histidine kinase/CheY-like chemotaxis protein
MMIGSDLTDEAAALELPAATIASARPAQSRGAAPIEATLIKAGQIELAPMDCARVGAGRMPVLYQPTDLAALTADLAGTCAAACERAGLTLTIETETLPEPVFVDQGMWEKIVLTLISHAVNGTLTGGIKVAIRATDRNPVLSVSDTGAGIPPAELPRIFEPIAGTEGRPEDGTGIGLALVQDLVWLHKGVIEVASTLGRGSCFTVRLPWGNTHLPQDRIAPAASAGPVEPPLGPADRPVGERLLPADWREASTRLLAPLYEVVAIAEQAAIGVDKVLLDQARRNAEAALRQLNETVEERVATEVAQRLAAEEVRHQAQKMEAIGQLTGGIAHDFNNLLQVVLGNLDTVRRHLEPIATSGARPRRDLLRPLDGAITGAERAASLTQRLLMLSRRQPLNPHPIDVDQLVAGMSELLRHNLGTAIAIETRVGPQPCRILADPNQLEAAILNLAANAREAMPAGGTLGIASAVVELGAAELGGLKEAKPGSFVMLALSDTGCGMTKTVMGQAFEPFFTTKAPGHGTGLGLAQVYSFVKQSGGHIKLESEPGRGTIVRLYLPCLAAETLPVEPSPEFLDGFGSETILLVEDDPAVRELSAVMLADLGYHVLQAETGMEALSQLAIEPDIELLFTDVGLPGGVDGNELADRARALRPALKVLFTSGYAKSAARSGGATGMELLAKPFTAAALASRVRQLLDR